MSKESKISYAGGDDEGIKTYAGVFSMKDRQIVKWQRVAYLAIASTLVSVLCVTYIGTKSIFIPYVIHVDEKTGYVQSLGALTEKNAKITDAEVNYFLSRFVEGMRNIPTDSAVLQTNVNRAVKFLTPEAANKYKNLYLNSFTGEIGTVVSRVTVLSCLPVAGQKNVYSVRWKETKTAGTGSVSHDYYYSGNFSIKSKPIYDKEELALNPIGLFITDFSISEEKETK